MNSASKRLFLATEVSSEWKAAINKFIEENKNLNYRWIAEGNWHFTLLFIGDFPEDKLKSIYTLLEKCFAEIPVFEIEFDKFTYFPPKHPRMIWCKGLRNEYFGLSEGAAYWVLKNFCKDEDIEFKAKPSHRPIPHITLSRLKFIKNPLPDLILPNLDLAPNPVKEIVLFSSEVKTGGAEYTSLASFKLKV
jgi:2'-5' RNA ligase